MTKVTDTSIAAVDARAMAAYAALSGQRRDDAVEYMRGVIFGRWGTVSNAARAYASRCLAAMGANPLA